MDFADAFMGVPVSMTRAPPSAWRKSAAALSWGSPAFGRHHRRRRDGLLHPVKQVVRLPLGGRQTSPRRAFAAPERLSDHAGKRGPAPRFCDRKGGRGSYATRSIASIPAAYGGIRQAPSRTLPSPPGRRGNPQPLSRVGKLTNFRSLSNHSIIRYVPRYAQVAFRGSG